MAFCVRCGAQVQDGSGFCSQCGAPMIEPGAPAPAGGEWGPAAQPRGGYAAPRRSSADSRQTLLKILSLVFAILFVFFSIGLGGRIYVSKVADRYTDISLDEDVKAAVRLINIQRIAAIARNDAGAFIDLKLQYAEKFNNTQISVDSNYNTETESFNSSQTITRENCSDSKIVDEVKKTLDVVRADYARKNGFQWTMLVISSCYQIIMLISGLLAIAALVAWVILGGKVSNLRETTMFPALLICAGAALIFLILFNAISPAFKYTFKQFLKL